MFDFITEEHKMIQEAARDFAQKSIAPIAEHFDETGDFPIETIRQMGELGFMGIEVPETYGGAEMDTLAYSLALTEICKADASHGRDKLVTAVLPYSTRPFAVLREAGQTLATRREASQCAAMSANVGQRAASPCVPTKARHLGPRQGIDPHDSVQRSAA